MNEQEKKGTQPVRVHGRYPRKSGINMNMREDRTRELTMLIIGGVLICVLAGAAAKFGVIDQYRRLTEAQRAYEQVHSQYTAVETALEDYDRVLAEYRTYSTDWMNDAVDSESPNAALYAAVDRQRVLDLIERDMQSQGTVTSVLIWDNQAVVAMSGMSLDQISQMFQKIGESPIVENVELNMAETEKEHPASILELLREHYAVQGGGGMNRELTGREKVMLLILSVLVMALGYYKLIFEPINDQVAAYRDSTEQEQTELTTELVRAEQLKKMESAVAELRQRGDVKPIPAYDNSKALMVELHRILASAQEYSLDFSAGTTEEDYIVLRPISLSYTTATYTQSRAILDALSGSDYMNKISDLSIQTETGRGESGVKTAMVITYFEVRQ